MPSTPRIQQLLGLGWRTAIDVVCRRKLPTPIFAHEEREVLRVIITFVRKDVERHAPEHLLLRLVSKRELVDGGKDVVVGAHV